MGSPVREYSVDSDALLDKETAVESAETGQGASTVSFSPSPFHVPVGVEIAAERDGSCKITFLYPNTELPETSWRALQDDPSVEVQYGRYTGKILQMRLQSAIRRLNDGPPRLRFWTGTAWNSTGMAGVAQRNARIVFEILANMPDRVRLELLNDLHSLIARAK